MRLGLTRPLVRRSLVAAQRRRVVRLASLLRRAFPKLDFGVVGPGTPGGLPPWITDLRSPRMSPEQERQWCRRYAESHMIVGVHGSNLVLPSAHGGSVIELVPTDRWGNLGTTIYPPTTDAKQVVYRYLLIPAEIDSARLADVAAKMLRYLPLADLYFCREWTDHRALSQDPYRVTRRWRELTRQETTDSLPPPATIDAASESTKGTAPAEILP
jgi:hypothetical protein